MNGASIAWGTPLENHPLKRPVEIFIKVLKVRFTKGKHDRTALAMTKRSVPPFSILHKTAILVKEPIGLSPAGGLINAF